MRWLYGRPGLSDSHSEKWLEIQGATEADLTVISSRGRIPKKRMGIRGAWEGAEKRVPRRDEAVQVLEWQTFGAFYF